MGGITKIDGMNSVRSLHGRAKLATLFTECDLTVTQTVKPTTTPKS